MSYNAITFVAFEVLTAANMNILGANDADFYSRIGKASMPIQQIVKTQDGAVATGGTNITRDDTIPQNTELNQFMTLAITPKATTNILVIEAILVLAYTQATDMVAALFQDSTANALATSTNRVNGTNHVVTLKVRHTMAAGTTSATTFKVRAGGTDAGTTTFNGVAGTRIYGGTAASSMMIWEYLTPAV